MTILPLDAAKNNSLIADSLIVGTSPRNRLDASTPLRNIWLALLATAVLMTVLMAIAPPRWESNDDVGMSMVVHGYGLAARRSPNLMFSNILWGRLIMALPGASADLGYSFVSFASLFFAAVSILYFLLTLEMPFGTAALVLFLLLARPTFFPQFTINAGLLTVAAILGWQAYDKGRSTATLAVSIVVAFLAFLIRGQEFFLLIGGSLPFVRWRTFAGDRRMKIGFLVLSFAILLSARLDTLAYQVPEWSEYRQLNVARAAYTDFHAGDFIKKRPDVMSTHGYSPNDIDLITNWFFADPSIANSRSLASMLSDSGWALSRAANLSGGMRAMKSIFLPALLPLTLCGCVILILKPDRKVLLSAALYLGVVFALGMVGRPAPARVGFAVVSLLMVEALICGQPRLRIHPSVFAWMCALACAANAVVLIPQVIAKNKAVNQMREDVLNIPSGTIVAWGADFPFESIFTPFGDNSNLRRLQIYSLGAFTRAPFSVAATEEASGFGLVQRLKSQEGALMVASPPSIHLLRTYCAEHWGKRLRVFDVVQTPSITASRVWCD